MNLAELQKKLLAAARTTPPSEQVPLAFERRILAQLTARPAMDLPALWAQALWQATAPCVALTLGLLALSSVLTTEVTTSTDGDLAQTFEQTLLAATDATTEESW